MDKIKDLAIEYWIFNTARIYEEDMHVSTPVIEAYEAGFKAAINMNFNLSENEEK
jgi:hypothetical protein